MGWTSYRWIFAAGLSTLAVAGCSSSPPPASLKSAQVELNQPLPLPMTPQAQASAQEARTKVSAAERAADDGRMEEADRLSQQALIDLRLARQQVAAAKAEQAAQDQQAALEALRSETRR